MTKVLFILKRREDFNATVHTKIGLTTGLYNSANYMNEMLNEAGIQSKLVVVIDNNDIDREVTQYRPTHVIIEALWVVPTKFVILKKLHPNVKWIIRIHSEMPFMANEGIAMSWIGDYAKTENVILSCNAPRMENEIDQFLSMLGVPKSKNVYLPNYYPSNFKTKKFNYDKDVIDIGCFGAIRPLKNHLLQAFAALDFAEAIKKKLHFHVNAGRVEMKGEPVVNNLNGLFSHLIDRGHKLIAHQWTPREEFLEICQKMDIGMQVSFSETFNIVAADLISQGVPVVGSHEIPWLAEGIVDDPTLSDVISAELFHAYEEPEKNVLANQEDLKYYSSESKRIWTNYFGGKEV